MFGHRVAPRCRSAKRLMIASLNAGDMGGRSVLQHSEWDTDRILSQLTELNVDTFVCGGIERELVDQLQSYGIRVIQNVAGEIDEVLRELATGRLKEWFGYETTDTKTAVSPPNGDTDCFVDCIQCSDKACQVGRGCVGRYETAAAADRDTSSENPSRLLYIAGVAGAPICRFEQFKSYCQDLGFRRVGVLFCVAAFRDVERLCEFLAPHIRVVPVCCRFGDERERLDEEPESESREPQAYCQPELLNRVINDPPCDLLVSTGFCMDFSTRLERHSHAPVVMTLVNDSSGGGPAYPRFQDCEERAEWRREQCIKEPREDRGYAPSHRANV